MKNRQAEIVQEMSNREILYHLYLTQIILFIITIILGFVLFGNWKSFSELWNPRDMNILFYGGGSAAVVIAIDFLLMKFVPDHLYDDGGINEKAFQTRSIPHILFLTILIAVVEEVLFRGVIQTNIGLILASLIFAFLHFRYLAKWVLFISVVLLSFLLGVIFYLTGNLWITIASHFLIDFVSAVKIRTDFVRKGGGE